tara:strand:- start:6201 stop:7619 length:1419 start_codon:yes stop_codon:yes gene_type:complete
MESYKEEKPRKNRLIDSLRIAGIFVCLISVLLVLFGLSALVSDNQGKANEKITGNLVIIKGEGEDINISIESEEVLEELNDNLICLMEGGLQEQDIVVLGNLLKDIDCPGGEKKDVSAVVEENCIIVSIEEEGSIKLCSEGLLPDVSLNLVESPAVSEGFFPPDVEIPTRNYYWYVLFFMILAIIILFWREYEVGLKTDVELRAEKRYMERKKKKERLLKKSLEGGMRRRSKKKEVFYIPPAPLYDEKIVEKREKEKKKIEAKIKKSAGKKMGETSVKKNKLILDFNRAAEKVNNYIISGKLVESRKGYIELFGLYSQLVTFVNKKNQKTLDKIMQYLCNYLGVLEKSKGIKRKGIGQQMEKEELLRPKPEVLGMDKLELMKELIKKKHYTQAKNLFYGGEIEKFNLKDAVRNASTNKEKGELKEIELRHDKILRKGVVNVDEDDFYKFMLGMTELRKGLKRTKKKGYKKKG